MTPEKQRVRIDPRHQTRSQFKKKSTYVSYWYSRPYLLYAPLFVDGFRTCYFRPVNNDIGCAADERHFLNLSDTGSMMHDGFISASPP